MRANSSAGRARASHARGRRFKSSFAHHSLSTTESGRGPGRARARILRQKPEGGRAMRTTCALGHTFFYALWYASGRPEARTAQERTVA